MILNLLVAAVTVTCALILHELGHAGAALALGCKVEQFHVWRGGVLGGPAVAIWSGQNWKHELLIAAAGPGVNILLALCIATQASTWWTANMLIATIALAPIKGSDGWRAWQAVVRAAGPKVGLSSRLFGCGHPRLTWPRTYRTREGTQSFQCCLDCGRKLPYTGDLVTK
jgi:hypothetical protein